MTGDPITAEATTAEAELDESHVVDVRAGEPTIEVAPVADGRRHRSLNTGDAGDAESDGGTSGPGSILSAMPWRTPFHGLAEVSLVALFATGLAWLVLQLWRLPLGLSMTYTGDELAGLAHVKGVDETGWWFTNPRLGAPFGQEHYDFPHGGETIQVAGIRLLGHFSDAPAAIINVYLLATYLLVAVTAFLVFRYLRFDGVLAGVVAVLYAFLPFHFWHHVGHIYRSGYFAAPIGALVLLWLAGYDGGLVEPTGPRLRDARLRRGRVAVAVVAVVLIAGTDVVAAAFAPAIAGVVGVLALLRQRAWRTLATALVFGLSTIAMVVVFNLPSLVYRQDNGPNPETVQRQLAEQEAFALKISRVVLPSPEHPIEALAELGEKPRASRIRSEGGQALGVIGVIGLISGIVAALPLTSTIEGRASIGASPRRRQLRQTSGLLMILILLIAIPSGLAYLASVAGFEEIRTWNRIVVYLGFYALLCAAIGLEGIGDRLRARGVPSAAVAAGLLVIGAVGLYDQVPGGRIPYEVRIEAWNRDAHFFEQLEQSVLAEQVVGTAVVGPEPATTDSPMVFQLPVVDYPEPSDSSLLAYDHFRAYLHTDVIAWSHGAMRGRPASSWQRQLEVLPSAVILDGLAAVGFDGLYIDKWGYADEGARVRSLIPDVVSLEDDRQFYYSLAPRAADLARRMTAEERAALADEVLHPVEPTYGDGFHAGSSAPSGGVFTTDDAAFGLATTGDEARTVTLSMTVLTAPGGGHRVQLLDGDGGELAAAVSGTPDRTVQLDVSLDIPVDGLALQLVSDSPEYSAEGDSRRIHLEVSRLVTVGPAVAAIIEDATEPGRIAFR